MKFLPTICVLLLFSCIEPYEFQSIDFNQKLVVDASLTNLTQEHFVKLSYTFPLDTALELAVSNATVSFIEESGTQVPLREKSPGHYVTNPDYAGTPGQHYQLSIVLPNGKTYLSEPELMREPVPIDSVYAVYSSIPVEDELGQEFTGVQLFVDSYSNAPEPHSFRYDFEESYLVPVPNPSRYDWSGSLEDFQIFEREQPLENCYRLGYPLTQLLSTTRGLSENRILGYQVRFISEHARELAYDYIIEVKQLTISNNAYTFYRQIREANESQGSLSDKQLGTMPSNVVNVADPFDFALGYFEVAGASTFKKRMSYRDFLDQGIATEPWVCQPHPLFPPREFLDETDANCYFVEYMDEIEYDVLFLTDTFRISKTGDTTFYTDRFFDFSVVDYLLNRTACGDNLRITRFTPSMNKLYLGTQLCSDCTTYGQLERPAIWDD